MKFFTKLVLVVVMLAPASFTFAHGSVFNQQATTQTVPTFSQCSTLDVNTCPEYRDYLLQLLLQLILEIQQARAIEAAGDNADETSDRVVVNLSRQEASEIKDRTYRILSNGTLSGESRGDVPEVVLALWNDFRVIAGDEIIDDYVISLRAYYDEDDVAAAYVETDADDYTKWILGLNIADYVDDRSPLKSNYFQVLVHEFAHILTLNENQLDLTADEETCGTYNPGEGCTYANSYLFEFVEEFWNRDDFRNSEDIESEEDEDERAEIAFEYYEENDDEFVTPYATTNPAEDIAESFAAYIFNDVPDRANNEIEEKYQFFEDYEELSEIRTRIRSTFSNLF